MAKHGFVNYSCVKHYLSNICLTKFGFIKLVNHEIDRSNLKFAQSYNL